jgi:phytoene synthase
MEQSRAITQKSASNLALAFSLLPREKRDAMSALYAFCRVVDDVADEDSVPVPRRRIELAALRADIRLACDGGSPTLEVHREFQAVIARYKLPFALFDELIQGCEMDLDTYRYETWEQLELYCHRVASVVGLLSIEIFGYTQPQCKDYALALGQALQLTNILRDVRNDAARGRIYLPQAALLQHAVSESEILQGRYSERFASLARDAEKRSRRYYRRAQSLLPREDRRSMVSAELMGTVYWHLLDKLEAQNFNVFNPQPVGLSRAHKAALLLECALKHFVGSSRPGYGF